MQIEDFVGRWVAGSERSSAATIEIAIVDGHLTVRAVDGSNGELAEIRDPVFAGDEVRFAAHWPSGQTTAYRLVPSDERLVVHATVSDTDYFTRDLNPDGTQRWHSGILHVVPDSWTSASLHQAIRISGRTDRVIGFRDDLSCGPIDTDDSSARVGWWASMYNDPDVDLDRFWQHVVSNSNRLIVWFGRHSAREYAFFLALADRLGDRPYDIVDVTGLRIPINRPGSDPAFTPPMKAVALMAEGHLAELLGTERAITGHEREDATQRWRTLKSENAPFRIVTDAGLVSAPADVFDELLMERVTKDWRKVARVVGETMGHNTESYIQVGDVVLQSRVVALVGQGKLIAHGDPWAMRRCEVRLPD